MRIYKIQETILNWKNLFLLGKGRISSSEVLCSYVSLDCLWKIEVTKRLSTDFCNKRTNCVIIRCREKIHVYFGCYKWLLPLRIPEGSRLWTLAVNNWRKKAFIRHKTTIIPEAMTWRTRQKFRVKLEEYVAHDSKRLEDIFKPRWWQ